MNWFKFEKALRLLLEYYPKEDQKKPSLFHSVRVWTYLYNKWYSEDLCIAWLLHDSLEDTTMWEEGIRKDFWEDVLDVVVANSKTKGLSKEKVLEDIVKKCVSCWESALVVKMADVYDNFLFYVDENIPSEIDRCRYLSELIIEYKPDDWDDEIFELTNIITLYNNNAC